MASTNTLSQSHSSPTPNFCSTSVDTESGFVHSAYSGGQFTPSESSTDVSSCIVLRVECLSKYLLKVTGHTVIVTSDITTARSKCGPSFVCAEIHTIANAISLCSLGCLDSVCCLGIQTAVLPRKGTHQLALSNCFVSTFLGAINLSID